MLARNEGSIVALSSCAGLFGLPNLVPYCGTKFAVRGFMQALTEELRRLNPQNNVSQGNENSLLKRNRLTFFNFIIRLS